MIQEYSAYLGKLARVMCMKKDKLWLLTISTFTLSSFLVYFLLSYSDTLKTKLLSSGDFYGNSNGTSEIVPPQKIMVLNEINQGIHTGNLIVGAIEFYFRENGEYPHSLDKLTPKYIQEIPETVTGQQYVYAIFDPHIYVLNFKIANLDFRYGCSYMRNLDTWECSGVGK